ncbi:MAG TPA: SUMF1/EgtB/PvdO family nonheme iron enzyme [Thermoanaerobaculia bacterium]|nr:SUMF1/EgtB/PvdO family nonheme iron enzyme [Thermoanaerobaculia bacterium]
MKHPAFPNGVTRDDLIAWFREGRARTREVFTIPRADMYYERPIALRNPIVFYEGHLPAFSINTLMKLGLERNGINEDYETLFARGIDPEDEAGVKDPASLWPTRDAVQAYGAEADAILERALCDGPIEDDAVPQLRGAEAAFAILEHEQMHQETLLYMFHNMGHEAKVARAPLMRPSPPAPLPARREEGGRRPGEGRVNIPAGVVTLGAEREAIGFAWDNELPSLRAEVPEFSIDTHSVTNRDFMQFVEAGGYRDASLWSGRNWQWVATTGVRHPHFWLERGGGWYWRGMFELIPLPMDWPVYVTFAEAEAYARWKGRRVPSEAEYHRAAYGTPSGEERIQPWGNELPDPARGNFGFANWDPVPVGSYPAGASAWGVHDLAGNGWEWTSSIFDGFPGFQPTPSYPVYSSDFFDGEHYVLKGASPATAPELIRRSFRNWFRPTYPYVYATFRLVR